MNPRAGKPGLMVAIGMPKGSPADGAQNDTQEDNGEGMGNEDCVPVSSLAMPDPDNGDQMATPAVGDRVNYTVEGTVTRIEGEDAYVKRETVNGQPVADDEGGSDDQAGQGGDDEDAQERGQLGGMADQMGGMS